MAEYSSDRGTPVWVLAIVKMACGGEITVDLCTTEEHNKRVGARHIYTPDFPCPSTVPIVPTDVVWCNPPGPCINRDRSPGPVVKFWEIWKRCCSIFYCTRASGAFLFFSVDHLRQVEAPDESMTVMLLKRRVSYIGYKGGPTFPSALVFPVPPRGLPVGALREHGQIMEWA